MAATVGGAGAAVTGDGGRKGRVQVHGGNVLFALLEIAFLNLGLFLFFAMSLFKPTPRRDWRRLGSAQGFTLLLFTEYYAVPLGIYLLSGWLQPRLPGIDWLSGKFLRLVEEMTGSGIDLHADPLRFAGLLLTAAGAATVTLAWRRLYPAARAGRFPDTGLYAHLRHPLLGGVMVLMVGILFLCPTLVTVTMFPVLVVMYRRSAREEEVEALARFGNAYRRYRERVPAFWPRWAKHER